MSDLKDTIVIEKYGTIITSKRSRDDGMIVQQRGDLLKLKTTWYPNRLFNRPHKLYFKVLPGGNEGQIILLPVTKWAKAMFENRDSIMLKKIP